LILAGSQECQELMENFIKTKPELWNGDIGKQMSVRSWMGKHGDRKGGYICSMRTAAMRKESE